MNKNFEVILSNNYDFIKTIKSIVNYLEKKGILKLDAYEMPLSIKKYFKKEQIDIYFKNISVIKLNDNNTFLYFLDKKEVCWQFNIQKNSKELISVFKVFEEYDIAIRNIKEICEITDNNSPSTILINTTERKVTKENSEIVLIKYDRDISFLIDYNLDSFIFPKINNISIKEAYEKKDFFNKMLKR